MRRLVMAALALGSTAIGCSILDDRECEDDKDAFYSLAVPPGRWAARFELTADSGLVEAAPPRYPYDLPPDAGPDTHVWAELGSAQDWLSMPCLEACRKAADLGLLSSNNATVRCAPGAQVRGKPSIECHYTTRVCSETRY